MIHIVYASEAPNHENLFRTMFKDRAIQFRDRLGWPVHVDSDGCEIDRYDTLNPLYLILEGGDGRHQASMRLLPTTGDTMINDHFTELTGGVTIVSPFIWECTRFCLAPNSGRTVSRKVLLGTMELGLHFGVQFFVGVFSKQMCRIYERIGWPPVVVGEGSVGGDAVYAGLWPVSDAARQALFARLGDAEDCADTMCFGNENWPIFSTSNAA